MVNLYIFDAPETDNKKKFVTGERRYCQCCGKESHDLFEVTNNTQRLNQMQCCKECAESYVKKETVANKK